MVNERGAPIHLTPTPLKIITMLAVRPNTLVPYQKLIGLTKSQKMGALSTQLYNLRQQLGEERCDYIRVTYGEGLTGILQLDPDQLNQ